MLLEEESSLVMFYIAFQTKSNKGTAPTNGSAGVLPAVLKYYIDFICPSPDHREQDIVEFLLTASAIGMLYKRGAR